METKAHNYLTALLRDVEDGYGNALDAYFAAYELLEFAGEVKKKLLNHAIEEAEAYPEKTFEYHGWRVEKTNSASRWDFSEIDEVTEAEKHLKSIKEKYKKAYAAHDMWEIASKDGEIPKLPKKIEGKPTLRLRKL